MITSVQTPVINDNVNYKMLIRSYAMINKIFCFLTNQKNTFRGKYEKHLTSSSKLNLNETSNSKFGLLINNFNLHSLLMYQLSKNKL